MEKKFPSGIDLARQMGNDAHADLIEALKDQLLIVFLKRLVDETGRFNVSVTEVDDTGQDLLAFSVQGGNFCFELRRKN